MANKIIIKKATNKQFFNVVKGGNNETIVVSETFKTVQGAKNNAKVLKRVIKNATVVDKTKAK